MHIWEAIHSFHRASRSRNDYQHVQLPLHLYLKSSPNQVAASHASKRLEHFWRKQHQWILVTLSSYRS
jgi:hypothetical protein